MLLEALIGFSIIATVIFHQYFLTVFEAAPFSPPRKYTLYVYSLLSSIVYTFLYGYQLIFETRSITGNFSVLEQVLLGSHVGYFMSDCYEVYKLRFYPYIAHHLMGILFCYLVYLKNYPGYFTFGMFNAEISAILVNLRYLLLKRYGKLSDSYEFCNLVIYGFFRILVTFGFQIWYFYLRQETVYPLDLTEWGVTACQLSYLGMSSVWFIQLIKMYRKRGKILQ